MIKAVALLGVLALTRAGGTVFVWPTSVAVAKDGSVLVVENGAGRVVRVVGAGQKPTTLAGGLAKPYAVAQASSGVVYLSNGGLLQRVARGKAVTIARAARDVGPIAVTPDGHVVYTDDHAAYELDGAPRKIATGLASPHGIAATSDGAVLVSDTGHGRVLRIDRRRHTTSTLIRVAQPRGVDVALDGTVYVVEAVARRVGHYSAKGVRLGAIGPVYGDPYDVAVARGGVVYVVDTAAAGTVRRIASDGTVTTL